MRGYASLTLDVPMERTLFDVLARDTIGIHRRGQTRGRGTIALCLHLHVLADGGAGAWSSTSRRSQVEPGVSLDPHHDAYSCSRIQFTACRRSVTVAVGAGSTRASSPILYLPVLTKIPVMPACIAPATSASTSSPIITVSRGDVPRSAKAAAKNEADGFPTRRASRRLANSRAATKGPASRLSCPSVSLNVRLRASAMSAAPASMRRNASLRV